MNYSTMKTYYFISNIFLALSGIVESKSYHWFKVTFQGLLLCQNILDEP